MVIFERIVIARVLEFEELARLYLKNYEIIRYEYEKVVSSILEHTAQQTNYFQFGNSSNNIRDIYATAIDYDKTSEQAQIFFRDVN